MGKDLAGVRSLSRKRMPDNVGSEIPEPTSLEGIALMSAMGIESERVPMTRLET